MRSCFLALLLAASPAFAQPADWPQFRGPNGSGLAGDQPGIPVDVGPEKHVVWKVALPSGHSSPIVHGDRIYLTGVVEKKLLTIALDRATGKTLWQREAPYQTLETVHPTGGSLAQSTPATDGERLVSFFGSSGLLCYDPAGKLLWRREMGPFKNDFGAGSSPIIVGDRVLLNQDHDTGSFLLCVDKHSGKTLWQTDRPESRRSYSTPVVWTVDAKPQVVVAGTLRVVGYDLETGKEVWTVRGLARLVNPTPVIGPDNTLYLSSWTAGGDAEDRFDLPPFPEMLKRLDANQNGTLEPNEVATTIIKERFPQFDVDKDGHIAGPEYEQTRAICDQARNCFLAIKPGGRGDVSKSHVQWEVTKGLPYMPSPVYHQGHLFIVKDGGLLGCLDAKTGQLLSQERIYGAGRYYSSPIVVNGKIYLANQEGKLSVVEAANGTRVLHRVAFGEDVYATPAAVGGKLYFRTMGHLYCFSSEGGR
ncbi:MAG: PQQ-binding-like beta-propeller repeat protein [Planctomycetia bacterium]|nr:PQQ-binding-like beta-propeller repeat protein [Planctomycetia bacterium]